MKFLLGCLSMILMAVGIVSVAIGMKTGNASDQMIASAAHIASLAAAYVAGGLE